MSHEAPEDRAARLRRSTRQGQGLDPDAISDQLSLKRIQDLLRVPDNLASTEQVHQDAIEEEEAS